MADPQASPISQLLQTLGITREDLEKRSKQMRQFLTAENATSLRVAESSDPSKPSSASDARPMSKLSSLSTSSTRSRSRAGSFSIRDTTPPTTPIKTEPTEGGAPLRHFDSMEMVIERQRRQSRREKKERRERERESQTRASVPQPPSPSPSNASQGGFNLDSFMQSRDDHRVLPSEGQQLTRNESSQGEMQAAPPVTPQRSKYYRDHTDLGVNTQSQPRKESLPVKAEVSTPTQSRPPSLPHTQPPSLPQAQYFAYPQYLAYARLLPPLQFGNPQAGPSALPVTPQHSRTYAYQRKPANSPLPPSSPPPTSSPISTPHRPIVNLVSSPGPMGPLPDEEEYDRLPYTLPPGPYSPNKPDLSYAALVGQAIISSPDHRLTLQEIYDWITIVYPHFKRGEQTWMNSIRHVLSTTVCFRKVPRDRAIGRTQWAIWDEDLECFKGGGFRKQLCKDIMNGANVKERSTGSKGKGKARKRVDTDDGAESRKAKRSKKDHLESMSTASAPSYMPATMSSHSLFPPTRPTPHHQPYYESCLKSQPVPGDIIFPPLPSGLGYSRGSLAGATAASSDASSHGTKAQSDESPDHASSNSDLSDAAAPPPSSSSSSLSSSVPELTPNHSSSSPPPASSEMEGAISATIETNTLKAVGAFNTSITITTLDDLLILDDDDDDDDATDTSLLGPVKDWGHSPRFSKDALQPGIKLDLGNALSSDDDDEPLLHKSVERKKIKKRTSFPPMPASPTLNRKAASSRSSQMRKASTSRRVSDVDRPTTPTPSTPPRSTQQLPVSSVRTPLSSKGINPAALHSEDDDDDQDAGEQDSNKTPRKRVASSGMAGPAPVTPRRLIYPANQNDSPFRTPSGFFGSSPFRTPGSRAIFDPHDPAALLDEELNRMGAVDSPGGLFGKGRGSLLYDSPGLLTSPSQMPRWW